MDGPSRCERWRLCLPVYAGPILYLFFSQKKGVDLCFSLSNDQEHQRQQTAVRYDHDTTLCTYYLQYRQIGVRWWKGKKRYSEVASVAHPPRS